LLLEYHADANCRNLMRETPMSVALRKHPVNMKLILLLLQYYAIPSTSFGDDIAVELLENANADHAEPMRKLIEENFINLTVNSTLLAAFDFAFRRGSVELAEKLLSNESYLQIEQLYSKAVYYSAKNNWPNILSKLLEKSVDVNALPEGETPLYLACERGETEIVKLLLSHGANPNIATVGPYALYPLQAACNGLHYDTVKLLLDYHADVNVRDESGETALHCAVWKHRPIAYTDSEKSRDLVQLLLDAGADVNAASKGGETPFYIACFEGLESLAKKMLECGATVNGNSVKKLPLNAACRNKHVSVVQLLLTNGANPNPLEECSEYRYRGSFPLHIAATDGNVELVELLLKHGADIGITDIHGNTALYHAIDYSYRTSWSLNSDNSGYMIPVVEMRNKLSLSAARLLLEHGADVNMLTPDGRSLLCLTVHALANARIYAPEYTTYCVIKVLQLLVKYGAELCDSFCQLGGDVLQQLDTLTLLALAVFDGEHDFVVELFRAGAGFKFLAICCLAVAPPPPHQGPKSISLCQAAVLAGYVPSAGELQRLQLAAARDDDEGHRIQQLVNWLDEDRQQVPSLQRQCRVVIRRQLSVAVRFQSILPVIDKLPLPTMLKLYLQFDGPFTEVDLNERMPTRP